MVYQSTIGSPEYDTYILIRQTHELLDRVFTRRCQMYGTTPSAVDVLYTVLAGQKPMSAYRLARILGREHHSIVEIVNRLKRKGLITRVKAEGKSSLEVTEAGKEIVAKVLSNRVLLSVLRSVGSDTLRQLRESLLPLRAEAMHELGLMDYGELKFASADEVLRMVGPTSPRAPL